VATRVVTVNEYDKLDRLVRQTVTTSEVPDATPGEAVIPLAKGGVVTPPGFRSGGYTVTNPSEGTITINFSDESADVLARRVAEAMARNAKRIGLA